MYGSVKFPLRAAPPHHETTDEAVPVSDFPDATMEYTHGWKIAGKYFSTCEVSTTSVEYRLMVLKMVGSLADGHWRLPPIRRNESLTQVLSEDCSPAHIGPQGRSD